ncbi:phosphoadenylyl-sulfate reductase [Luteolibacter luteus]|uniref:Phosphoadenosine 5'-phosphosulfate reductase n=1 Tax=Luteolibacter luteus TaxID=2728835 RepID=A0A858RNP8_9BACT|nr:phosphoadenylyl-sulfate reductase [Luteolibacter luteus]QJE98647.1 phosphoadenylyl-sulfate reductase [Luteolibacter luteus]
MSLSQTATLSEAEALSADLARLKAGERLQLLHERYGKRLIASTSFGLQAAVMLDLISRYAPEIPVVWIDTGFNFPETYRYAEDLANRFGTDLRVYQPTHSAARMEALWGKLWEQGLEGLTKYAMLTKIEPMDRALRETGGDVWISGLRRSQSSSRVERPYAEQQKKTLKVYPILDWADAQVSVYMHDRGLPQHPLAAEGYVTMGDWHSTKPAVDGLDAEATRFNGEKYECGLHLDSGNTDFQI